MSQPPVGPRLARFALDRLGYGPRPDSIDEVLGRGVERWVQDQLEPAADSALDTRLRSLSTLSYTIPETLSRYEADPRSIGGRPPGAAQRALRPRRPLAQPARGGPRRFLVQPLQRLPGRRSHPLRHRALRHGRHPATRAGPIPRPARCRGRLVGDDVVPRQLPQQRPRHQRELRARADGAAHARGRRRVHAVGRRAGGPRLHGLGHRPACGGVRLPQSDPRPDGQDHPGRAAAREPGEEGRRRRARPARAAPVHRALHLHQALPKVRVGRPRGRRHRPRRRRLHAHQRRHLRGDAGHHRQLRVLERGVRAGKDQDASRIRGERAARRGGGGDDGAGAGRGPRAVHADVDGHAHVRGARSRPAGATGARIGCPTPARTSHG